MGYEQHIRELHIDWPRLKIAFSWAIGDLPTRLTGYSNLWYLPGGQQSHGPSVLNDFAVALPQVSQRRTEAANPKRSFVSIVTSMAP